MKKDSKRIKNLKSLIVEKNYSLDNAVSLLKTLGTAKFIESVEAHISLNIDPKYANQQLRTSLVLPNGTGKSLRIAVFTESDYVDEVLKMGATIAGSDDLLEDINPTVYMNRIAMVFVGKTGKTDTIDELRTLSKTRPINAGSSTVLGNFMIETMFTELSIPYQVIPYKNNVNMLTDTVNGSLDILLDTYIGAKPMLETGKVKIIASTFDKRTANKYNHESIQSFSRKLGKMPLGILLSVNPSVSKESRTMLVNSIYECNKDSDVLNKLESMSSGPMFYTTEEIRNIVKSVAKK